MKKSIVFLSLFLSLFFVSACTNEKTRSLEEIYKKATISTIDKIIIQKGSTGASKTITAQEQIDDFLSLINT
ncbi:hypothetical protein [Bacillus sp. 1P06AnD]|uniref:hypothetical protein n=1 Tax=Bacillus sp. 1P06AnD TaxID=3132208 RepID=UPI0039A0F5D4